MNLYENEYLDWLMKRVDVDPRKYSRLMELLHQTPFIWKIREDKRRAMDGMALREEFIDDFPYHIDSRNMDYFFTNWGCSVCEMLVAFAIRIDNEYIGAPNKEDPGAIFWEMICNLGLDFYENRRFSVKKVQNMLNLMMQKSQKTPFPCRKNWPKNYEKWEFWAQMTHYLTENY